MSDENKKTIDAYEHGLAEYKVAAIPEVIGSVKEWIDIGLNMLPSGGRILELGSGLGRDADYMEARGFSIDRTDVAQTFVTYLIEQGHHARLLNALDDGYGGVFDMIFANAVLLHFDAEQVSHVLERVSDSLSDKGIFSFSVKIGHGSGWSGAKLKQPRFFTYWKETDLKAVLKAANLEIVFWEEGQTGHDNGNWYHVITQKISNV